MSYPKFIDEIAFASDPFDVSQVYTDLSTRTRVRGFDRGRQKETIQPDKGTSMSKFESSDRALDPINIASPYYPNVLPMRRSRCRVQGWLSDPATLTVTLNEINDATRAASALLGTGASGNMCDDLSNDSSFGIRRAATNFFRRGQCDTTADLTQVGAGVVAFSTDATTPPRFSTQSIKVAANGAAANQGVDASSAAGAAMTPGSTTITSCYFKGVAGQSYVVNSLWHNTDLTDTLSTDTTFLATGGWQLLTPTIATVAVGKTGDSFRIRVRINGTRAENFWIAHVMVEGGRTVVSPYVATSGGATATHNAGRVQAPSSLLNATQGWFAVRLRMGWGVGVENHGGAGFSEIAAWSANSTTDIRLFYKESTNEFSMTRSDGVTRATAAVVSTHALGDVVTLIGTWTAAGLRISFSQAGSAFSALVAHVAIPALGSATLFDIATGGTVLTNRELDSDVLWFACGTGTLTDADAAAINAFGNTDKLPEDFNDATGYRAACQAAMPFATSTYRVIKEAVLYTNFIDPEFGWQLDQLGPGQAEASVTANDGFDVLTTYKHSPTSTYPQQTAGARIVAILDAAGWPTAERSIDITSTQSLVQAAIAGDLTNVSALAAIQAAAANDNGIFFIDGRGYAIFMGRHRETDPRWATSQATFCDKPNWLAGRVLYKSITPSSSRIRNEYRVTRKGGTEQVWNNPTSVGHYRTRSESAATLHVSDAEALSYAQYRVLLDKDPHRRYDEMTIVPLDDTATWRLLLGLGIGDRITVFFTPPGGGAADQRDMIIEGISAKIGPGVESEWKYRLSPATDQGGWVLGDAVLGLLGSTTVLTY